MALGLRQAQFTLAAAKLIAFAAGAGLIVKVQEWQRDLETQKRYVAEGFSKTMDSRHLDRLAVDLYILDAQGAPVTNMELYRALGVFWESLGGRWGGRFNDRAAWRAKNGRDFDPAHDLGWDPYHFEFTVA